MRLALAFVLVGTTACGERPPPTTAPGAQAPSAPAPLEVAVAEDVGAERTVR